MPRSIACTILFMALLAGPAGADAMDDWYGGEYETCADETSTIGIATCVDGLHAAWDGRLNTAYQAVMNRLEGAQKTALRDAQRAWIAYRDANCAFYAAGEGTIAQIETAVCMYALTRQRAEEMEMLAGG